MTFPNNQAAGPKNTTSRSSNAPPPAYTPRRAMDLGEFAARVIQQQQGSLAHILSQRPYTTIIPEVQEHPDDQEDPDGSPISLRITTAVNISKNNNIVCLPATPSEQANAIAAAVVEAIHRNSSGQCGIPMIDENGCPRPLKIEVDASMLVEGSNNVVGNREMIDTYMSQRKSLRRRREETDDECEAESSSGPAKRRRST